MKHYRKTAGALVAICLLPGLGLQAAENYGASLKAGDEHRKNQKPDAAIVEYDAALGQSDSEAARALPIGKKGYVMAFDKKDYAAALKLAQEALAITESAPVAQVTALQVLAECQMKGDKNYAEAVKTLEKATKLQGVDWAQPMLAVTLGDCLRFSGQFDPALDSYRRSIDMPAADSAIKAIAYLSIGLTWQYSKNDPKKARAAYAAAEAMNPGLKAEIATHVAKLVEVAPEPAKP